MHTFFGEFQLTNNSASDESTNMHSTNMNNKMNQYQFTLARYLHRYQCCSTNANFYSCYSEWRSL